MRKIADARQRAADSRDTAPHLCAAALSSAGDILLAPADLARVSAPPGAAPRRSRRPRLPRPAHPATASWRPRWTTWPTGWRAAASAPAARRRSWRRTSRRLVAATFATWGVGAVSVPIAVRSTADEAAQLLTHARARALICDAARAEVARERGRRGRHSGVRRRARPAAAAARPAPRAHRAAAPPAARAPRAARARRARLHVGHDRRAQRA